MFTLRKKIFAYEEHVNIENINKMESFNDKKAMLKRKRNKFPEIENFDQLVEKSNKESILDVDLLHKCSSPPPELNDKNSNKSNF